jgi:hypothetical protein
MKISRIVYVIVTVLLLQNNYTYSQFLDDNIDLLVIREDIVEPSMSNDYELFLADIKSYLEDKKVKNFNFFTHVQDDYVFSYITPIKNLHEIDNNSYGALAKQMQDPELNLMLDLMNETLDSYRHYIIKYQPSLSYVPENTSWGENTYRKWNYYYFYPGTEAEVESILTSWKNLYESKNAKMGFRVFTSFLGEEKPLYILTTWGKNPLDYQNNLEDLLSVLGEDGAALWLNMMQYVRGTKTVEGWYLPQYSFAPDFK